MPQREYSSGSEGNGKSSRRTALVRAGVERPSPPSFSRRTFFESIVETRGVPLVGAGEAVAVHEVVSGAISTPKPYPQLVPLATRSGRSFAAPSFARVACSPSLARYI